MNVDVAAFHTRTTVRRSDSESLAPPTQSLTEIPGKAEAMADLQKVEALLQQTSAELPKQILKAQRAASVASEVERLAKAT